MGFYRLSEEWIGFPDPTLAEDDGLLAIGGDLSIERLLLAYSNGIFPWYNPGEEILWWCPKRRFVIIPGQVHVSASMRKWMKREVQSGHYQVYINRDFKETIHQCRLLREEKEGTWITDEMEAAYCRLHERGYACSVEVYRVEETDAAETADTEDTETKKMQTKQMETLVGGLYGVSIGKCFFGESMFSKEKNVSKLALIALSQVLKENAFLFIDCQFHTDHLESMGGRYIEWDEFDRLLQEGIQGSRGR